jgi:hypothetical protein
MEYTADLIKKFAPSAFATQPSPKMTNKYTFVPTDQVIEFFDREGWKVSSVKQTGKGIHGLHEIKFRNSELPKVGDTLVEAIVRNSHNGSSAFSMGAGLFRLVCSNGLTVPTAVAERFTMRHNHFSLDDVKELADSFSKKLPMIEMSVGSMMARELTTDEKIDFVRKSAEIRFGMDKTLNDLEILNLLTPNRKEDENDDMWSVFNVVQEKYVRGGVSVSNNRGRVTKMRKIDNILVQNNINTKLWQLAESMV